MASENKLIKELVNDDEDATAELEALTNRTGDAEADAHTLGFDNADDDALTVEKLQFDIEQLRSKWLGLEAEIKAREEMTANLSADLRRAEQALADEQKLLQERDRTIRALKAEVHERDRVDSDDAAIRELQARHQRTETCADDLRRQLKVVANDAEQVRAEADRDLSELQRKHEQEIKTLRFELGEAEDTLAQNEDISEQLASDLVETRGYRDELERMLSETEQQSGARIEELEKQVSKFEDTVAEYEEKLESKNEAINCLLQELAKKTEDMGSIGEMDEVIQEIDDRMSERIDDRPAQRVTRLLIGRVGDQELRFPLFKNRLTIGRTGTNDIQLKAQYISRRHAIVVTEGDATRVVDWGSKNGVYVNSNRVTEHFLKNGDIVSIGTAQFRYEERRKRDH